jgi:tRNA(Arg) A34 adenosine deaminase TadA
MNPDFMQLAIKIAWEGYKKGQEPFGSCVVKGDKVLSVAHNTINTDNDPTAHAEMNAIREAGAIIESPDLSGCEIYATFLPCGMCMEAIKRSGIDKVYFGAGPNDVLYPNQVPKLVIKAGYFLDECLELVVKKYPLKAVNARAKV